MKLIFSHFSFLFAVVAVFCGVISFPINTLIVAQTNCPPGDTPATLAQQDAWQRNATVNVNFNSIKLQRSSTIASEPLLIIGIKLTA